MLVSTVQQSESAMRVQTLPPLGCPSQSAHRRALIEFPELHSGFSSLVCLTHSTNSGRVSAPASQFLLPRHSTPLWGAQVCALRLSLFLLCKYDHLRHFPISHVRVLICDTCCSRPGLLHSAQQSLGPSPQVALSHCLSRPSATPSARARLTFFIHPPSTDTWPASL